MKLIIDCVCYTFDKERIVYSIAINDLQNQNEKKKTFKCEKGWRKVLIVVSNGIFMGKLTSMETQAIICIAKDTCELVLLLVE